MNQNGNNSLFFHVDTAVVEPDGLISVSGWAFSLKAQLLTFRVSRGFAPVQGIEVTRSDRSDVSKTLLGNDSKKNCGFTVTFSGNPDLEYTLSVSDGRQTKRDRFIPSGYSMSWKFQPGRFLSEFAGNVGGMLPEIRETSYGTYTKQMRANMLKPGFRYEQWLKAHEPGEAELERQRSEDFGQPPKFSIIVPVYRTPEQYLRELVDSCRKQTWSNFEICFADGSGPEYGMGELLSAMALEDPRIRFKILPENLGISGNTNEAIAMAEGDWLVFLDHDDVLAVNALYELAVRATADDRISVIYTDEDKVSSDLNRHFDPAMKPDYDPVLLASNNYICHLTAVKKSLADRIGPLDPGCDGSQDHDYLLRCTEENVCLHIPKVLYHWRSHAASTASDPESKFYCSAAGAEAVNRSYARRGIPAHAYVSPLPGHYATVFDVPEELPLISCIVWGDGNFSDFERTRKSLLAHSAADCLEILPGLDSLKDAAGEYLFFIRCGSELAPAGSLNPGFDGENALPRLVKPFPFNMTERIRCQGAGIVAALITDDHDRVAFAGSILNRSHCLDELYLGEPVGSLVDNGMIRDARHTATASLNGLMIRRKLFEDLGGLNESLRSCRAVDLSFKVLNDGYPLIYDPMIVIRQRVSVAAQPLYRTAERELKSIAKKYPSVFGKKRLFGSPNRVVYLGKYVLKE